MTTGPIGDIPEDAANYGSLSEWSLKTEDEWKNWQTTEFRQNYSGFWGQMLTRFLDGFSNFADMVASLTININQVPGLGSQLGSLGSLLGIAQDDIIDLQDRTQELEGVVGYGCAYMDSAKSGDFGVSDFQRMEFGNQIGPMVGCDLDGIGYVLANRGLWRIDAQMYFDTYLIGSQNVEIEIRVYSPDGATLFAVMRGYDSTGQPHSLSTVLPVVVPGPGYLVRVYARAGIGRGFIGGPNRTFLTVSKLSAETDHDVPADEYTIEHPEGGQP